MALENMTDDRYEKLIMIVRCENGSFLSKAFGVGSWRITESDAKGYRVSYINPEKKIISEYKLNREKQIA